MRKERLASDVSLELHALAALDAIGHAFRVLIGCIQTKHQNQIKTYFVKGSESSIHDKQRTTDAVIPVSVPRATVAS